MEIVLQESLSPCVLHRDPLGHSDTLLEEPALELDMDDAAELGVQ